MRGVIDKGKTRIYRRLGLCLVLASTFSVAQESLAQDTSQANRLLLPSKSSLVPVHGPDLTQLEPAVREQLTSQQSVLAATLKDPKATDASLSEAYGAMGETYHAYSLSTPARECYLNASRLAPREFRWIYLLAKLDQQDDLLEDAIGCYRIAGTLRPGYLGVPVNLGNIYLQLNRLEDANDDFKAALAIDQDSAAALYGLGQVALSLRKYAEAADYFERALKVLPSANRIHYSLAMAYRGLGDTERATAHLAQQGTVGVRVSDPMVDGLQELIRGERVHLARGKLALEARQFADADNEFRKAIAANRDSIPAHVNLGAMLIQTGDLKRAAEEFEAALRVDPKNSNAHYNLAFLLANEKNHNAAILHLQTLLSSEPNDLSARFFLAQELLKSERRDEALSEFSRIVETDPSNEDALLEQVKLLQQKKQYRQALDNLKKANAQYPERGQTAVMLAYLLAASPQYDLRNGERALKLAQTIFKSTGLSEHGAVVAMAMAELGRCTEAAEWQRRMIAAAEQEHKTDLVAKLSADLKLYDHGQPCRPGGAAGGR